MLRFSLFGFPVGVDLFFWLTAALISGGLYAGNPDEWGIVAVRVGVVFVSILVHELGHALAGRQFGSSPAIRLHGFGGVTFLHHGNFSRTESIIVSAAGPLAGLALGTAVLVVDRLTDLNSPWVTSGVEFALYVNFFWTFINLLPIQPLDGGQILREVLGPRRRPITNWVGCITGLGVAVWAYTVGWTILAIFLALLAISNLRSDSAEGGVITQ